LLNLTHSYAEPLYNIGDEFDSDSLYDEDMSREPLNTKEEVSFSDEDVGFSRAPTPMDQGMLDLDNAFGSNLTVLTTNQTMREMQLK